MSGPGTSSAAEPASVIAHLLGGKQRGSAHPANDIAPALPRLADVDELGRRAKALHRARRSRNLIFEEHGRLFGEPAWDMLLELFIAYADRRSVDISSAAIGADAPLATGLRYAKALQAAGLAQRWADPHDKRRGILQLTEHGIDLMARFLSRGSDMACLA